MILVLFKNQSAVYGTVTQKQVSCKNCLYEWFFFSVSIGLFNFYSLHATVISWCTLFLEAAWKFTLEFPRLVYCLVFLFRFSLPLNSVTSIAIYFIVTNNSSFQLIQTGNVSVIMSLPRELVLMFSELIFACITFFCLITYSEFIFIPVYIHIQWNPSYPTLMRPG